MIKTGQNISRGTWHIDKALSIVFAISLNCSTAEKDKKDKPVYYSRRTNYYATIVAIND